MTIEVNETTMELIMGTNYHRTTFEQSRKDRLCDIIGDYLTDEETEPEEFIQELKSELNTWLEHHEKHFNRCKKVMDLLGGN